MAFPSIIFQTSNTQSAVRLIPFQRKENNPDLIEVNKDSTGITIEMIRELQATFIEKPFFESHKLIIIYGAESMNLVCQNALLKFLEEPPSFIQCVLVTHAPATLLATIRSRCQLITDDQAEPLKSTLPSLAVLQMASMTEIMDIASQVKERAVATAYILQLINELQQQLELSVEPRQVKSLQVLQQAYIMLNSNTNVKLVMEWVGFQLRISD